ncbi:TIGR00341 family protein [Cyclonatronum proteinivorum]|uniref:TIGR00341 family protein n=1 Tax=Cyclonatronum proteinivorum TaxID=1457365 RepID=A0A345UNR2_9BACT|nr:TIGR00341 family protein [Cyclonatronum proteinivorum]AXJ02114.1 TIGR00341 family protein [Cyclonatronum proteinivorum]
MALRLIQIYTPAEKPDLHKQLDLENIIEMWVTEQQDGSKHVRVLCEVEYSESLMQQVSESGENYDGFRVILLSAEATIPKAEVEESTDDTPAIRPSGYPAVGEGEKVHRISIVEMYEDVKEMIDLSWVYVTLTAMSTLVAATGMLRDNPAIVIGAMVIAPLLGPNVGLSLATTLGDQNLLKQSLKSLLTGFSLAFLLSVGLGLFLPVNAEVPELLSRTEVSFADIALGIAAGVAGVLSFTRGISAAVIGVMVAVALLPPLVATGLYLGTGETELALGAALLMFTYVVCFNLAGIITLLAQGVTPKTWREKREQTRFSPYAIIVWVILLLIMGAIIYFR